VADYAARRGPDPWPARAADLSATLGCPDDVVSALTAAGDRAQDADAASLRERLVSWVREDVRTAAPLLGAFTGHGTDVEHPVVTVSEVECSALAAWLGQVLGEPTVVLRAEVIGGGFSRRMLRAWLEGPSGSRRVIVRVEQGGMFGTDTDTEVRSMRALHDAGFAVPAVLAVEPDGSVLGQPLFVMEEIDGQVRLDDDGLDDVIRAVAALHRVPVSVLAATPRTPEQVVSDVIDGWLTLYREHSPIPIPLLEHAAAWLHERLEPTGPSVIAHGDAGPGNALFHPERGLTLLDWEFAHVGDAAEDWVYLSLIRGRRVMNAEAWRERLRTVAGIELSAEQWRTWLAFGLFRGACVNLTAQTVFEAGPHRTADQLAIGVAVHLRFLDQLVDITCAP
jgi:aminoglycoside phosphotransferase (APT) family kinase protein